MSVSHESVHDCIEAETHSANGETAIGPEEGEYREYHECSVCGRIICFYWPYKEDDPNHFDYHEVKSVSA
jgi:hypothetical protein